MSHLVTEDDRPVDNRFSERQQRMLPHILFSSWDQGRPFEALSNVGLFSSLNNQDTVVPDFMLSLGVEPRPVTGAKEDLSYFIWVYGKAPDLVVEVVSNLEGEELTRKFATYARVRVTYYAVYDPFGRLGNRPLRLFRLVGGRYVDFATPAWMPEIGLGLVLWDGQFDGIEGRWLRFLDEYGRILPTAQERAEEAHRAAEEAQKAAEEERRKAEVERSKTDQERQRADQERGRADLAEKDREEILKTVRATIMALLTARLGQVPPGLEAGLAGIDDARRLTELSGVALRVSSAAEFSAELGLEEH